MKVHRHDPPNMGLWKQTKSPVIAVPASAARAPKMPKLSLKMQTRKLGGRKTRGC